MIPQLKHAPQIDPIVLSYLHTLKNEAFSGDIATDYATRLTMATDNSIYQLLPAAVLFPRSEKDVCLLMTIAQKTRYSHLKFTPRGGGTGTNGQALNRGIIVDMSRYMTRILDVNLEEGWVNVQSGVIKDQLNEYLKPFGYFFCPELSTSNRATIGGMVNTDASGQGSMVYGKTSDHVLGLSAVLADGSQLKTQSMTIENAIKKSKRADTQGEIYRAVIDYCSEHRELIEQKFPKLNRFLTGYDLKHVFSDDLTEVDLTRLLTGSEGSLAFITQATLNIIPIPKVRYLVNIKYDSFQSALCNAPFLVKAQALSVETIDSKVLNLAREDIIWQSVKEMITDVEGHSLQGLNIVEFAGHDEALINDQVLSLCRSLDKLMSMQQAGIIGYQTCNQLSDIEKIYAMRKKAVGLLGNTKGAKKPIPFVEDTCVPPQHLANYITEFRQLLDSYGLDYGMFGHVDSGVLHVRPALDMCDLEQARLMKVISDEVVALTAKYGGLLWGEHGKGLRSEYSPALFGETLYLGLRTIKTAFDPLNRLNPGKICTPLESNEPMLSICSTTRGSYDRQIPVSVRTTYHGANECNGNGLCFNFDVNSPMCPSMKITADRIHSPKGRAGLVREWLRLLIEQGVDEKELNAIFPKRTGRLIQLVKKINNSLNAKRGQYDFSHEVKASMALCLACKTCSTQCPIKIDVPDFKARFLQLYHSRYLRPIRDHLVGQIETYLPLMGKAPRFFNFFMKSSLTELITNKTVGMVSLPQLSYPTLKQQLIGHQGAQITLNELEALSESERKEYLLIVQDPFTTYYDAKVVYDFVLLVEKLGFKPVVLPFMPNGKPQHIKGFLQQFAKTAQSTADALNRIALLNIPMVGVDPALVLCYRDEYRSILQAQRGDFQVLLSQEWLMQVISSFPQNIQRNGDPTWYLLGHCTESTALPESGHHWQNLFALLGAELKTVNVGCCGMAGTFGHEVKNLKLSKALYAISWQQVLHRYSPDQCLTTGYSCRSQVKRFEKTVLKHPLQVLLTLLN